MVEDFEMKRVLSFLLVMALLCSLFPSAFAIGSTKKDAEIAFNTSYDAYKNINSAYEIVEELSTKIYDAWKCGIYDGNKDDFKLSYLAKEVDLPLDDLKLGMAYDLYEDEWDKLTEEEKKEKANSGENIFILSCVLSSDSVFSICVSAVISAYKATGKIDEVEGYLAEAKQQMRSLSQKYSDYEHYPALKGFFTTTSAFFDFCKNPTGSFEQLVTTLNDYKNTARRYKNDVAFIFED
jgi:hypothetical protein